VNLKCGTDLQPPPRSRVSQINPEIRACLFEVAKRPSLQARWVDREIQGIGRRPTSGGVGFGLLGYLPIKYPDSLKERKPKVAPGHVSEMYSDLAYPFIERQVVRLVFCCSSTNSRKSGRYFLD